MVISYGKPIDKGVTRLMYVGDDLQPVSKLPLALAIAIGLYLLLKR